MELSVDLGINEPRIELHYHKQYYNKIVIKDSMLNPRIKLTYNYRDVREVMEAIMLLRKNSLKIDNMASHDTLTLEECEYILSAFYKQYDFMQYAISHIFKDTYVINERRKIYKYILKIREPMSVLLEDMYKRGIKISNNVKSIRKDMYEIATSLLLSKFAKFC